MALKLSGAGVGYGCSTHGYNGYASNCEECITLQQLCRVYGSTPEELNRLIEQMQDDRLLARMQTPEWREGAQRAFNATPEELGKAAVEQAKKKI